MQLSNKQMSNFVDDDFASRWHVEFKLKEEREVFSPNTVHQQPTKLIPFPSRLSLLRRAFMLA